MQNNLKSGQILGNNNYQSSFFSRNRLTSPNSLRKRPLVYKKRQTLVGGDKEYYFKNNGRDLPEKQQRYCRCLLHVAAQQSPKCLKEQRWGSSRGEDKCYNPYAICTKSVGQTPSQNRCTVHYNLDKIPPQELQALLILKQKSLTQLQNEK